MLREAPGAVAAERLVQAWPQAEQRDRCLAGLLEDGLVVRAAAGAYALP